MKKCLVFFFFFGVEKSSFPAFENEVKIHSKLENHNIVKFHASFVSAESYYIITELGRGSYSIVWLAYHKISNKFYAVKVHDLDEYKSGLDEINFVKLLPKNPPIFNNLIEYFNYIENL